MYRTALIMMLFLTMPIAVHAKISANHWAGSVIIGPDDAPCDNTRRGAIRYESVNDHHEYCDGAQWKKFVSSSDTGDISTPATGTGYFVLSAGVWNGNLGDRTGANAKCLSDLTSNDWLNKDDAVARGLLVASRVRAFLCISNTEVSCNNALPMTTYTFAVSGDPASGGASFTTDNQGRSPGNTQNWAGTNYFNGDARYWANRGSVSADLWSTAGAHTGGTSNTCGAWSSNNPAGGGATGNTNNTGQYRWQSVAFNCSTTNHLICMVDP